MKTRNGQNPRTLHWNGTRGDSMTTFRQCLQASKYILLSFLLLAVFWRTTSKDVAQFAWDEYEYSDDQTTSTETFTDSPPTLRAKSLLEPYLLIDLGSDTSTSDSQNLEELESKSDDAIKEENPSSVTTLHLIGERHSGTKWMTQVLNDCFGNYSTIQVRSGLTRWKHWFQTDGTYATRNAVVVAQFRHVLQWVEAMRIVPYHSPAHINLTWNEFVTKPWTMERYGLDVVLNNKQTLYSFRTSKSESDQEAICSNGFDPHEVVPCFENETLHLPSGRNVTPLYELNHDGSGQPYASLLELRRDKIYNFLSVAKFQGVKHFEAVRYEDMVQNGTSSLVFRLEKALGVSAHCQPTEPRPLSNRLLTDHYLEWMYEHVDWDAEDLLGYNKQTI